MAGVRFVTKQKLLSKVFVKGFREGFAAPVMFFDPPRFRRAREIDASMEAAWREVGKALNNAYRCEGERIGERAVKKEECIAAE